MSSEWVEIAYAQTLQKNMQLHLAAIEWLARAPAHCNGTSVWSIRHSNAKSHNFHANVVSSIHMTFTNASQTDSCIAWHVIWEKKRRKRGGNEHSIFGWEWCSRSMMLAGMGELQSVRKIAFNQEQRQNSKTVGSVGAHRPWCILINDLTYNRDASDCNDHR